jgi:hypothetical protein
MPATIATCGRTPQPESFRAYLRGRYYWNNLELDEYHKGQELEPDFAPAHYSAAMVHRRLSEYDLAPRKLRVRREAKSEWEADLLERVSKIGSASHQVLMCEAG